MNNEIGFGIFVTGLLMLAGHYFPWPNKLRGQIINRLFAYSWGVGWVMTVAFCVAGATHKNYLPLLETLYLFLTAGLSTATFYGYDYWREVMNRNKRRENSEQQSK